MAEYLIHHFQFVFGSTGASTKLLCANGESASVEEVVSRTVVSRRISQSPNKSFSGFFSSTGCGFEGTCFSWKV